MLCMLMTLFSIAYRWLTIYIYMYMAKHEVITEISLQVSMQFAQLRSQSSMNNLTEKEE